MSCRFSAIPNCPPLFQMLKLPLTNTFDGKPGQQMEGRRMINIKACKIPCIYKASMPGSLLQHMLVFYRHRIPWFSPPLPLDGGIAWPPPLPHLKLSGRKQV